MFLRDNNVGEQRQRGIALVSVLVTVALVVGLVASLAYQQNLSARRTGQILHSDQAIMYLFSAESFAKILLNFDAQHNAYDRYSEEEPWGRGIENEYDGGSLNIAMIELNGRFNLNNLRRLPTEEELNSGQQDVNLDSVWHPCYQRILQSTVTTSTDADIQKMVQSLEDWLDEDLIERSDGAEDNYYSSAASLEKSYKTGNNFIADPRELILIKGYATLFEQEQDEQEPASEQLLRSITVLPVTNSKINVNTATKQVLSCLEAKGRLTDDIASRIISFREEEPFTKLDEFYSLLDKEYPIVEETVDPATQEKKSTTVPWSELVVKSMITVSSQFYMMKARLIFGLADVTAYTTLQRTPDGGVRVIARQIDAL